jgi:hypothetical protein
MGYNDPYPIFLGIDIAKLDHFIKNNYTCLETVKGFSKLGYPSPLNKFLTLTSYQTSVLLKDNYNSFETMKSLAKLGYQDPFTTFFAIEPSLLQLILKDNYNSFELIKFFKKVNYPNPLQTFLNMNANTRTLFLGHEYAATQIMTALYNKGKDPIVYLEKLGTKAMAVMFASEYEYVSRIKRGVNLELEFLPAVVISQELSPALKAFIELVAREQSNSQRLSGVKVAAKDLEPFRDSYTRQIVLVPVRLDGDLFDLETLRDIKPDAEGFRLNPITQEKFLISALQPAKDVQRQLNELIKNAEPLEDSKKTFWM